MEMFFKELNYSLAFFESKQAMINEDAMQAIADGFVNQGGGNRGIHSARKRANHMGVWWHTLLNLLNLLVQHGTHRPVALQARDIVKKALENFGSALRVGDLRVKLQTVNILRGTLHRRDRTRNAFGH